MKRIPVQSSQIKSIGYNYQSLFLEIEFKRGTIYLYQNVPYQETFNLIFADSIGSYFNKNIAKQYLWVKIKKQT